MYMKVKEIISKAGIVCLGIDCYTSPSGARYVGVSAHGTVGLHPFSLLLDLHISVDEQEVGLEKE